MHDDFAGTSLDPAWTRHGVTSGDETWLSPGLRVTFNAGEYYSQPEPAGTAYVVELDIDPSNSPNGMTGPMIMGPTGYGACAAIYHAPQGLLLLGMAAGNYNGSFINVDPTASRAAGRVKIRLRRDGTNYYASWSDDNGATWSAENAPGTFNDTFFGTASITDVGFGEILNGATSADFFDFTAGTPASGLTVAAGVADETEEALAVGVDIAAGPQVIAVGVADETEEALSTDVQILQPLVIPVDVAIETDTALGITTVGPLTIAVPLAQESDSAFAVVMDDGTEPTIVRLGKAVETEEALELEPMVQTIFGISLAEESEFAFPLSGRINVGQGNKLGVAIEREQARSMRTPGVIPGVTGLGAFQTLVLTGPAGFSTARSTLVLDILEREPLQAPTSILVSVLGALPNRAIDFSIDGVLVDSALAPDGSGFGLFSVPVPEEQGQRGEHTLTIDQNGAVSASAVFTLKYDPDLLPTNIGPDAPPVEIPESIHPSGVRRWVLQDLMPGGLGSYVMPLNPAEMDNPAYERVLTAKHTTAVNEGQFHVSEGAVRPLEWSFKGYCPTQEMAETLRAFAELRRRFYIHDHRGRAWIVVVTSAEIIPRLQQRNIYDELTDWVHDYTVNAVIFDRAEFD